MKVDLSINSTDGVTVLPKIKQYLDTMPALCPIIMTVKMFLAVRDLNSAATGGLGSYALTLMAISFLHVSQLNVGLPYPTDLLCSSGLAVFPLATIMIRW